MHYRVMVAIPGAVKTEEVSSHLAEAMNAHAEQHGAEWPGLGEWDWWFLSGRSRGAFTLTPQAYIRSRAGILNLPTDADLLLGGFPERQIDYYNTVERIQALMPAATSADIWEPLLANQTDCARLRDIERGSISVPFYWIDLDGHLHDLYFDPHRTRRSISEIRQAIDSGTPLLDYERLEAANTRRFRTWISALPAGTWLINVIAHR